MVEEAELDSFLGKPVVPDGDNNQPNQDQLLDKKHVTKCGLLKVLIANNFHMNLQFRSICYFQHFLFDVVLPLVFFWFFEVQFVYAVAKLI